MDEAVRADTSPVDFPRVLFYSGRLELTAHVLPWVIVTAAVAVWVVVRDAMYATGLLAAALAALMVVSLGSFVPEALDTVLARGLFLPRESADPGGRKRLDVSLRELQRDLDSRKGWLLGAVFVLFAVPQLFLVRPSSNALESWWLAGIILAAPIGAILGVFAWRMLWVGAHLYRLGDEFDCQVQTQHPDGAGGFAPLGEICFRNALILVVPSIFLGAWRILLGSVPTIHARYGNYASWFDGLLIVTVALALVAFVAPLYGIHRAMVRDRNRRQAVLDGISNQLNGISNKIRTAAARGDHKDVTDLKQQLAVLSEVYGRETGAPTWPVDTRVTRKFLLTQIVPLISLTRVSDYVRSQLFGS